MPFILKTIVITEKRGVPFIMSVQARFYNKDKEHHEEIGTQMIMDTIIGLGKKGYKYSRSCITLYYDKGKKRKNART